MDHELESQVFTRLFAVQIASYKSSERDLFIEHLEYTQKGNLLILDRGYPAIFPAKGQGDRVLFQDELLLVAGGGQFQQK